MQRFLSIGLNEITSLTITHTACGASFTISLNIDLNGNVQCRGCNTLLWATKGDPVYERLLDFCGSLSNWHEFERNADKRVSVSFTVPEQK
jgi:hypothetical protein